MKAQISEVIGQYIAVKLDAEGAIKLLETLRAKLGKGGEDVDDAIRMIRNFDAFYDFMRKKFKEYLTPKKNLSDMIKGLVIVDKIKLIKENDTKYVVILFDRSISKGDVLAVLSELGYEIETSS
ncbi:MAG TPA: hypothetical protein EYP48_01040 [Ignisphaera sp.]|uniref:Uncharacterized protein n=1 Tax=Ignisphaera aggregans TaxID=334771 RepID=A0A833DT39_9CREN|nr:hypothetical protein [Ignisphaera sp.]HIP56917.1 hypothetical protein [Ignisphaera aggregans]